MTDLSSTNDQVHLLLFYMYAANCAHCCLMWQCLLNSHTTAHSASEQGKHDAEDLTHGHEASFFPNLTELICSILASLHNCSGWLRIAYVIAWADASICMVAVPSIELESCLAPSMALFGGT